MRLILLALLLPLSCYADVYRMADSRGSLVRLLDTPCKVSSGWLTMKEAEFTYQGKTYFFCSVKERDDFLTNPAMSLSMMPPKQ